MHLLKAVIISIGLAGLIVGCNESTRKEMFPSDAEQTNRLRYFKDNRTNLCFTLSLVSEYPAGTANIYSYVPCTPEVEKLLIK